MSKKVLCIDTGELFNTIGAAAKTVMGTGNNLWKAIKAGITYHNKKFVYVDETEATPETQHFGAAKERAVIDMNTGKIYASTAEMGRKTGIPRTSLRDAIKNSRSIKGYRPLYYDTLTAIKQKRVRKLAKLAKNIEIRCVETNRKYKSFTECARKLDCPVNWVQRAVYAGETCMGKHYVMDYTDRNVKLKEEKIIDVTTGEIWETPRLCAGVLKISEYNLRRAILKKEVVNGHYLEWLFIYNEDYTNEEKQLLKGYGK